MFRSPPSLLCASCLRQIVGTESRTLASPFWFQARGKKRLPRSQTILVKLIEDIPGYGRKDAILPVAPGRMRNIWFPRGLAEYVTHAKRKLVQDQVQERDSSFLMKKKEESETGAVTAALDETDAKLDLLSPQRSQQIIEELVPAYLDFYRKPILTTDVEEEEPPSQPEDSSEAILEGYGLAATKWPAKTNSEDAETEPGDSEIQSEVAETNSREADLTQATASVTTPTAIFGSVSTTDIATSLRALLSMKAAENGTGDAARVILTAEDIDIVPTAELRAAVEGPRIKASGEYGIQIRVKGGNAISRTVRVNIEESS